MRIAIDLQPCQTESRWRGIGRYTGDLAQSLLELGGSHEFILGVDGTYPVAGRSVRERFSRRVPEDGFLTYQYPLPRLPASGNGDFLRAAAEAMVRHSYAQLSADVVHVNSLFEGFIEHAGGLGQLADMPGAVSSVTLYDVIPLVLPDWYLTDPAFHAWYQAKLRQLARFDVVLCISEATRRDAIERLGLPEDRLAVINAGVDAALLNPARHGPLDDALRQRFGIGDRYVLYTGNADPRKNLSGAIRAFAEVPSDQRQGVQLVLNQVGDPRAIRELASSLGLAPHDLAITGHVSDAELESLLRNCEIFFFPSLYEGFGLPVLEAMACGAPTICADNSSLPEVMGRRDALFDASSVYSASAKLSQALSDPGFRASLREHGRKRAAGFTWEATASLALDAWSEAFARRRVAPQVAASSPRLKIALVTPLPPEQTGIADYVAEALTALGNRLDIELFTTASAEEIAGFRAKFPCRHWSELDHRATHYDQIVYQMGNSPFHAHMLELIERHRGVVVMHDVFLSSLIAFMDGAQDMPGLFPAELCRSHGRGAVAVLDERGRDEARRRFPCSGKVLEYADGIIVHSQHSAEVLRTYYPAAPRPPVMVAPMPVATRSVSDAQRQAARSALGIGDEHILIVSFGFVADTKCNIEILHALAEPPLRGRGDLRIAFVGGVDGGDYGARFRDLIADHPLASFITVTGFADAETYASYLEAADVAVQLRTGSRGETSKSVLDCLAYGIPTIVNDYGSFSELPDEVVVKTSAAVSVDELAAALANLVESRSERCKLAAGARQFVRVQHLPDNTARVYEECARLSLWSRDERTGVALSERLYEAASMEDADEAGILSLASPLQRTLSPVRQRLYVDMTDIHAHDHGTGIQRVVRNVVRELMCTETPASRCIPVRLDEGFSLQPLHEKVPQLVSLPALAEPVTYAPAPGDVLFLLDSTWVQPERFRSSIDRARAAGVPVYAMVYDLIPQRFPQYCTDQMPAFHRAWLRFVVAECDGLVCISKAVADDLLAWIRETGAPHRQGLRIDHVPLGSDVAERRSGVEHATVAAEVCAAFDTGAKVHLMVGTLEPRKRHELALDAFDRLWSEGDDSRLVIIGRKGWHVDEVANRILAHPRFGQDLFWFQGASDADLNFAYARAHRVIQASAAEGYGLPLVEAARHGCPILASDIPVFREVAGETADYFVSGDVESLVTALKAAPSGRPTALMATWADCAVALRALFSSPNWRHALSGAGHR